MNERIVVQKFGGTSVSTPEMREICVMRIARKIEERRLPVVVVSAMGRRGEPYATDTLVEMLHSVWDGVGDRERDLVMSCGETISAAVLSAELMRHGIRSRAMTAAQAGLVANGVYGAARIVGVDRFALLDLLRKRVVPVIAGFQAAAAGGEVCTLGRGGSDITAASLATALGAEQCEIYTDVAGIMSADPRIEPKAQVVSHVTYAIAWQMARLGAKVLHKAAISRAAAGQIPMRVCSLAQDAPGTLVERKKIYDLRPVAVVHRLEAFYVSSGYAEVYVVGSPATSDLHGRAEASLLRCGIVSPNNMRTLLGLGFCVPVDSLPDAVHALHEEFGLARK